MPTPDPNIRMSNAEREAVIGRLQAATEEGRLGLDEFAERSRQVYEARTFAEVERLLEDLPDEAGAVVIAHRTGAAASELRLTPTYSRARREGSWTVPKRLFVAPKYGSVRLDCRHAKFSDREVEVEVDLQYSPLEIILPRGASAIDDGVELHGGRVDNRCHDEGGPRIHLTGRTMYAGVRVRYERRFLWWRW